MEVAAEVETSTSFGSARSLAIAISPAFAQLGRDPLVAQPLVELVLGACGPDLALDVLDAVFRDRQAAPNRVLAKLDVVALRAGEVEEVAVGLGRHDAQVEAQSVVETTVALVFPFASTSATQVSFVTYSVRAARSLAVAMMSRSSPFRCDGGPSRLRRPRRSPGGRGALRRRLAPPAARRRAASASPAASRRAP